MKKMLIACLGLYFGLFAITACENQTEGQLLAEKSKDAPPDWDRLTLSL